MLSAENVFKKFVETNTANEVKEFALWMCSILDN